MVKVISVYVQPEKSSLSVVMENFVSHILHENYSAKQHPAEWEFYPFYRQGEHRTKFTQSEVTSELKQELMLSPHICDISTQL